MSGTSRPLVLCYHAVSESWPHALAVDEQTLLRQVESLLRRGYRPTDARGALGGGGRFLHVTFDDAFRSVERVLPALEQLAVRVTVFACADYAQDGRPLAVPELAADAEAYPDELATMAWDELRGLAERGVEVGSHTLSHPHLTWLSDKDLDRELRESRRRIEDELGSPCPFLAYPYGDDDERVHAAARSAGYEAAFALPGRDRPFDRYAVPRVGVYRRDGALRVRLKTDAAVRRHAPAIRRLLARRA